MRGIPITLQDVSIREGKVTVKQDQGEVTERIWAKHPRFYQSPLWIRRVRLMLKLMNIAGVVLAVAAWQLFDIRQEGLVYIFCPLAFYITYQFPLCSLDPYDPGFIDRPPCPFAQNSVGDMPPFANVRLYQYALCQLGLLYRTAGI